MTTSAQRSPQRDGASGSAGHISTVLPASHRTRRGHLVTRTALGAGVTALALATALAAALTGPGGSARTGARGEALGGDSPATAVGAPAVAPRVRSAAADAGVAVTGTSGPELDDTDTRVRPAAALAAPRPRRGAGKTARRPAGGDPGTALADRAVEARPLPATATALVGQVTRLWLDPHEDGGPHQEQNHEEHAAADQQTWVVGDGARVQVPTADLAGVAAGATVRVDLAPVASQQGSPTRSRSLPRAAQEYRKVARVRVVSPSPTSSPAGGASGPQVAKGTSATAAAATTTTPIAHTVTLVMARTGGAAADTMTAATLRTRMTEAAAYWKAQSRGRVTYAIAKTWTNAATGDWLTTRAACTDHFGLWSEVAGKVGFTGGDRNHLVVYVTGKATGCSAGLGTVGSGLSSGGYLYVQGNLTGLIAHELGHNMSLGHSNGLQCNGVADGVKGTTWSNGCQVQGYRDYYDVMGISWANLGTLSSFHARRLGVIPSAQLSTVSSPSWVTLAPVASTSGVVSAQVKDPAGPLYTVEYRPATGADAWLAGNTRGLRPGVLVRRQDPGSPTQTLLLDGSPSASGSWGSDWDEPLSAGRTFVSGSGRLQVQVTSVTSSAALLQVGVDGVWPAPRVTPTPTPTSTSGVRPPTTTTGAATAVTRDGTAVPATTTASRVATPGVVTVDPSPQAPVRVGSGLAAHR